VEMVNLGAVSLKRLGCYGGGIFFFEVYRWESDIIYVIII